MTRHSLAIAACTFVALVASRANAQTTRYWIDPAGGTYTNTSNWSATSGGAGGATAPVAGDTARFQLAATYNVVVPISPTVATLEIQNGNVTFDLSGFLYSVTNSFGAFYVGNVNGQTGRLTIRDGTIRTDTAGDDVIVGSSGGTGFLTIEEDGSLGASTASQKPDLFVGRDGTGTVIARGDGNIFATLLTIGEQDGGTGTVTIDGSLAKLEVTTGVVIGESGEGTVNVTNGARANLNTNALSYVLLGNSDGGSGELNASGAGTRVTTANVIAGDGGYGQVTISAGAVVVSTNNVGIGESNGSGDATVTGAGSRFEASQFNIGGSGRGTLTVSSSGTVAATGGMTIAENSNSEGTVAISGTSSRVEVAGTLLVGRSGTGNLSITSGTLSSGSAVIGQLDGGVGEVAVAGSTSQWAAADIVLASLGKGTLRVSSGAVVNIAGDLDINDPTGATQVGTFNLDGGSVFVGDDFLNDGVFNFTDGLLRVAGDFQPRPAAGVFAIDGVDSTDLPTLELVGNAATTTITTLTVGDDRRGQLIVRDGRSVNVGANAINIGALAGGEGIVNIGASGTLATSGAGSLTVGGAGATSGGTGTINIGFGGTVDVGTLRLHSGGTINLNGGLLAVDALGPLNGQLNWTAGTVRFDAALTTIGSAESLKFFGADRALHAGRTLANSQELSLSTQVALDGGNLSTGTLSLSSSGTLEIRSGAAESTGAIDNTGSIVLSDSLALLRGTTLNNTGTLRGTGLVRAALNNTTSGRVQVTAGQRLQLDAATHTNAGLISVIDGELQVGGALTNSASTGLVSARDAILRFNGGVANNGSLAFSNGTVDVYGDIQQAVGGRITISAGGIANFYDDVTLAMSAANVQATMIGTTVSKAVFFGSYNGGVSGGGQAFIEGDHRPGNSPGVVEFDGDLFYGPFASLHIELGGLTPGLHDQIIVDGDLAIHGALGVSLLPGYMLGAGQDYLIADVDGVLFGQFAGLDEGDLVGNFSGRNLFITYAAGDGNDVALFTAPSFTADFDDDGDVDGDDLNNFWRPSFGLGDGGDADGDSDSDGDDFLAWQRQLGSGQGAVAASSAVPEPTTWALLGIALFCGLGLPAIRGPESANRFVRELPGG